MTPEDLRRASRALVVASLGLDRRVWDDYTRLAEGLRAMADAQPVAWQYKKEGGGLFVSDHCPEDTQVWNDIEWYKPLYTTPQLPQWQGLTEDERQTISLQVIREDSGLPWRDAMATAIESALRAKNGGA